MELNFMTLLEKNWKLVAGLFALLVIGGAGFIIQAGLATAKEKKAQEAFFKVEKKYTDYKTKSQLPDKPEPTQGAVAEKKPTPEALAADLTTAKAELQTFIGDYPKSKATQMAALYFAEIARQENNKELALTTLQKVQTGDSGLVNTLVQQQIGQLLADTEKCKEAIDMWQKIVTRKEANFLHNELKIQQALCYQKLNDPKKAEELLTNIANQKVDDPQNSSSQNSSAAKEAARYLRLMQIKKVSGT